MPSEPAHAEQSRQFARRVLDAFRDAGRATDPAVAQAHGPSDSYMTQLRNAAYEGAWVPRPRSHTQQRIESAANWRPGSTLLVWDGGDPIVGPSVQDEPEEEETLLYRRPDGLSDQEWERVKRDSREYIEWQIEKAARER